MKVVDFIYNNCNHHIIRLCRICLHNCYNCHHCKVLFMCNCILNISHCNCAFAHMHLPLDAGSITYSEYSIACLPACLLALYFVINAIHCFSAINCIYCNYGVSFLCSPAFKNLGSPLLHNPKQQSVREMHFDFT